MGPCADPGPFGIGKRQNTPCVYVLTGGVFMCVVTAFVAGSFGMELELGKTYAFSDPRICGIIVIVVSS